jgi:hypothetical protein
MLTGYLSIICMAIAVIYTVIDLANDVLYALPAYVILFFIPVLSLFLVRVAKYKAAKVTLKN